MTAVWQLLWNLCLLRAGPERMPTAPLFVGLVVIGDVLLSAGLGVAAGVGQPDVIGMLAANMIMLAVLSGIVWIALQLGHHPERFLRTITALLAADLALTLLATPPILLAVNLGPDATWLLVLVELAILFWWLTIAGFVLRRALEFSQPQGVALALFAMLLGLLLSSIMLPPPPST